MAESAGSVMLARSAMSRAATEGQRPAGRPVRGARRISAALAGLAASTRYELLTFDDPVASAGCAIPGPFLELAGACMRAAAERAAEVRRIVPRHALSRLEDGPALPGRARLAEAIPFKMIVVDRMVAAVPLDLELLYNGLLLIRDPVVVQALARAHHACWEAAEELSYAPPPSAPSCDLPSQLRPVLDALLAGLTDETAAARLGMSARTYSRRVGELMAALGTTSRFRAGAEAARRGWL
ncbi:DNA-binding response regulator [Streptomyces sp. NPDC093795]|uniref:helix-turn-helix transcriptional regulator n=1 Tax=Streptomyces sp. NPDC093795 TaxID=3366051 RepID=UPI003829A383